MNLEKYIKAFISGAYLENKELTSESYLYYLVLLDRFQLDEEARADLRDYFFRVKMRERSLSQEIESISELNLNVLELDEEESRDLMRDFMTYAKLCQREFSPEHREHLTSVLGVEEVEALDLSLSEDLLLYLNEDLHSLAEGLVMARNDYYLDGVKIRGYEDALNLVLELLESLEA